MSIAKTVGFEPTTFGPLSRATDALKTALCLGKRLSPICEYSVLVASLYTTPTHSPSQERGLATTLPTAIHPPDSLSGEVQDLNLGPAVQPREGLHTTIALGLSDLALLSGLTQDTAMAGGYGSVRPGPRRRGFEPLVPFYRDYYSD